MRLVSFAAGGSPRAGAVLCEFVIDLALADPELLSSVLGILDATDGMQRAQSVATELASRDPSAIKTPSGEPIARKLSDVRLHAPIANPRKLLCLAGNYEEHIRESGADVTDKDRITPRVFIKPASNTLCGPGDPILLYKHAQLIDYEAELAVIIGRKGKYIPVESALAYVAGYTCINDISERNLRIRPRETAGPRDQFFDWLNGKWTDNSAPLGPWIVTADEIGDPQTLDITLKVNGEIRQSANTRQMIFSIADLIHYISQFLTLEPGDIIATGTPAGVGNASGKGLQEGDHVEMWIEKIGTLANPVQRESDIE